MAECPWCHAQVQDARGPCPRCGKHPNDLRITDPPDRSVSGTGTAPAAASSVGLPPAPLVPDLVLPTRPSAPRVPSKAPPMQAALVGLSVGVGTGVGVGGDLDLQIDLGAVEAPAAPRGGSLSSSSASSTAPSGPNPFEDDDFAAGPSLELDVEPGAPGAPGVSLPAAPLGVPSQSPAPLLPLPASSLNPPSNPSLPAAPLSQPAPRDKPAVDPFEAQALADYGAAPEAFWQAPLYAYRVLSRRPELRRELVGKRVQADASARSAEDECVAFGERAREALERVGGRGLEQVLAAEEVLRGRDGALAGAMDAHKAALAEVDARLGAAEAEAAHVAQQEAGAQAAYEAADADRKRADAKVKRLDIEVRNAAIDPSTRAAERAALAAEVTAKEPKITETQGHLLRAQQASKTARARVGTLRGERESLEQGFARNVGTRSAGVEEARQQVRAALVALGRAMIIDTTTPELDAARAEVARKGQEALLGARQVALYEAAVSSYDVGKVLLGAGLVIGAVVLLVVLLLFPFIYRAFVT